MYFPVKIALVILLIFSSAGISGAFTSFSQDFVDDAEIRNEFQLHLIKMVEDLEMSDSIEVIFYEIYTEYGLFMKEAYENRVGWLRLNHQYQWASRDRDTKLKMVLNEKQFNCFIRHQSEIEREARNQR